MLLKFAGHTFGLNQKTKCVNVSQICVCVFCVCVCVRVCLQFVCVCLQFVCLCVLAVAGVMLHTVMIPAAVGKRKVVVRYAIVTRS